MSKVEQIRQLEYKISNAIYIANWRERNGFKHLAKPMWDLVEHLKSELDKLIK